MVYRLCICIQPVEDESHFSTYPPILAYPSFDQEFVLETDASVQGLGTVLSQKRTDDRLHSVAYASRALSPPEKNYGITDLETLAVVWAMSHFRHYLYGKGVTVYTDHTAVKSVLESSNLTGKHARLWTRVYGCGRVWSEACQHNR